MTMTSWEIPGAEGLPIRGDTDHPEGEPRGVAVMIHGFTGNRYRNIVPAFSTMLAEMGFISHRPTLSHAGVGEDGDTIERLDEFERDSLEFCLYDIRAVIGAIHDGTIEGRGLPLVLAGHSRGAAQALGAAGLAAIEHWDPRPAAVISLASTATFTRMTADVKQQLQAKGYVERVLTRAKGGKVRMGPSWYEHHFRDGRDLFDEYLSAIECPVLIAHGTRDDSVPPESADEITALLEKNPHCDVTKVMVENADHNFNALGFGVGHAKSRNPQMLELGERVRGFLDGVFASA